MSIPLVPPVLSQRRDGTRLLTVDSNESWGFAKRHRKEGDRIVVVNWGRGAPWLVYEVGPNAAMRGPQYMPSGEATGGRTS